MYDEVASTYVSVFWFCKNYRTMPVYHDQLFTARPCEVSTFTERRYLVQLSKKYVDFIIILFIIINVYLNLFKCKILASYMGHTFFLNVMIPHNKRTNELSWLNLRQSTLRMVQPTVTSVDYIISYH